MDIIISMREEFRPVFIDGKKTKYEIGNYGTVRNSKTLKKLNPAIDKKGYERVCLTLKHSKKYTAKVHRLVAEAFIPNPENKPTVNHKNGNKRKNYVTNLEWATHKEQVDHVIRTGLKPPGLKGIDNPTSIYTLEQIHMVCSMLEQDKLSQADISRKTNVSRDMISRIRFGKAWTDVSCKYNISKAPKLQTYSDELRDTVKSLILAGKGNKKIIHELNLDDTVATYSFVNNIRVKLKREGSTTIKRDPNKYYIDIVL